MHNHHANLKTTSELAKMALTEYLVDEANKILEEDQRAKSSRQ